MSQGIGFCVVYRFRVRPGAEDAFRTGWTRLTEAIRDNRGGLGSRLHLADDGWWVAYAQWPDRESWERSQQAQSPDSDAAQLMADAIEERRPPILMQPEIDLLVSVVTGR